MALIGSAFLNIIRWFLALTLIASVLLICANAFGRYVLWAPIIWAEEVLGYSLVWTVYLGAILVTAERSHLKMDLVFSALGPAGRRALELIANLTFAATCGLIIYQGWFSIADLSHKSQVAGLPMDIVHAVVPVAFALMVVALIAVSIWPPPDPDKLPETDPQALKDAGK